MGERTAAGYLARGPARMSVVVLHEAYGLFSMQSNVPQFCDRLAGAGYQALAPDLYGGLTADTVEDALQLMGGLQPKDARAAIGAAIAALRREQADRVAVLGFCMGGALAFQGALDLDGLCGAVVFYGTPRGDVGRLRVPVLGHFALRDRFVSLERVQAIEAELRRAGKRVTFHYYDAEHAFMNEQLASYAPECAALAWERTRRFLDELAASGPEGAAW